MTSDSRKVGATVALAIGTTVLLASRSSGADANTFNPVLTSNFGEIQTARMAGMGDALRATGNGAAGVYLNPATLPVVRGYQIAAITQVTPEVGQWIVGGNVVDSVTSRLAGGFSIDGTPVSADPNGANRTYLNMRLALALPVTDRLMLGLAGRYLKVDESGVGPLGSSAISAGAQDLVNTVIRRWHARQTER